MGRVKHGRLTRAVRTSGRALVPVHLRAWSRRLGGLSRTGLAVAGLWFVAANTPSLLPRPWWLQGLIAAICAILGYATGHAIGAAGRAVAAWAELRVSMNPRRARLLTELTLAAMLLFALAFPFLTIRWQQFVNRYVGHDPPGWEYPIGSMLVAIVTFVAAISLWRLVADLLDWWLARTRSRVIRETTARVVASVLTLATVAGVLTWVARPLVLAGVEGQADRVNRTTPVGHQAPSSPLRSGGPGSPRSWESLGQDGAIFVSSGPDAAAIEAATERPASEPIRVFAGVADSLEASRDAVLAELDRTGAWQRRSLLLVTPTSTGYVNTWGAAAFEYLQDGDTAVAGFAYSDLPSAFGLLTGRDQPPRAARMLLDAVRARLAAMPASARPKLYVTGESLGAYGGDGAFSSPEQMLAQVDGAVWSGTPTFAPNRAALTDRRTPGSTMVVPVLDDGRHIRFAGRPEQLDADEYGRPLGTWAFPRVVYLQHASDPVAWWSPDLMWTAPAWLQETRRDTPMAQMSWTPQVTFWQITADMLVSNNVPGGFGHRYYGGEMVPAWSAVLGVTGRTPFQLERIADAVGR